MIFFVWLCEMLANIKFLSEIFGIFFLFLFCLDLFSGVFCLSLMWLCKDLGLFANNVTFSTVM